MLMINGVFPFLTKYLGKMNNINLYMLESVHSSFQKSDKSLSLDHFDNNQNCMRRKLQYTPSIFHSLQTYCNAPNHLQDSKVHMLLKHIIAQSC